MLKQAAFIILTVIVTGVSAQEATPDTWMTETQSTLSRPEVHAQAVEALRSGELARLDNPGYLPVVASSRSRIEVIGELDRARANGEFAVLNAEVYDFASAAGRTQAMHLARRP